MDNRYRRANLVCTGRRVPSYEEFKKIVGVYHFIAYFRHIDIKPDTVGGDFYYDRLPELEEYCRKNPEFHIMSLGGGFWVNDLWPDVMFYQLADGDNNPRLYYQFEPLEITISDGTNTRVFRT